MTRHTQRARLGDTSLLEHEHGTIRRVAAVNVGLGYGGPYVVGASSLGLQTVYRAFNDIDGLACGRFFFAGGADPPAPRLLESGLEVGRLPAVAFSLAYEPELLGVATLLLGAGISPLTERRRPGEPIVIAGGPLGRLDPFLLAPFADVVVLGEAEVALPALGRALAAGLDRAGLQGLVGLPGVWLPATQPEPPAPAVAPLESLPAAGVTWSPAAALADMFLVEATRGCCRACAFCVLSRDTDHAPPFRAVPIERILSAVPIAAPGVGLLGAAVTDHPRLVEIAAALVDRGQRVSLSSVRADRVDAALVEVLKRGGARGLTLSVDGLSARLRDRVHKGLAADQVIHAAELAHAAGLAHLKLYAMVGLPGETDDDLDELQTLLARLPTGLRIALSVQPFVPKPGTPLADAPFLAEPVLRRRLARLEHLVSRRARVTVGSPRLAALDHALAHGGPRSFQAALEAARDGGTTLALRRALVAAGLR